MIEGKGNGGWLFLGGVGIAAIGLVGFLGLLRGVAISPFLVSIALSLGLHLVLIDLIAHPDVQVKDIKGVLLFIAGAVFIPVGAMGVAGAVIAAIAQTIIGLLGLL
ncbi:MAG: hypothetical protein PHO57_10685 [Acidithiobacillus sp.]|nr:hypothetical protein [Acidithiobacillus sp.]